MPPRPRLKLTTLRPIATPRTSKPAPLSAVEGCLRPSASPAVCPVFANKPAIVRYSSSVASASSPLSSSKSPGNTPPPPPTRWLSDLRARLGKCIIFGCSPAQVSRAAGVTKALATEWRELTVGSEGFLTGKGRGLEGQRVVWGEMDSFQHVNNVMYIRYAESSRVNWVRHFGAIDPAHREEWFGIMTPKAVGLIMKSIKADYKIPIVYPDTISAYTRIREEPSAESTSLILDCAILSHNHRRVAARTEEDIVVYDYGAAKKATLPPFMLELLQQTFRGQEKEKTRARARIWELMGEVEALEKETWDKPDAKEDIGAAK